MPRPEASSSGRGFALEPVFAGVNLDAKEYGPVKDQPVAGRTAKVFERKVYEYLQPESIRPEKIPLYERFVVIPVKQGFYVLRYTAAQVIAEKYRSVFEKVVSSFKPKEDVL